MFDDAKYKEVRVVKFVDLTGRKRGIETIKVSHGDEDEILVVLSRSEPGEPRGTGALDDQLTHARRFAHTEKVPLVIVDADLINKDWN